MLVGKQACRLGTKGLIEGFKGSLDSHHMRPYSNDQKMEK